MIPDKFIEHVRKNVEKGGIKLSLLPSSTVGVEGNIRVNGFFDGEELAVAVNKSMEDWFPVLIHEYSHFLQWREDCPSWQSICVNGEDVSDTLFLWIKHKKRFSLLDVKRHSAKTRDLEVDCEKRTVEIIRDFKLDRHLPSLNYLSYTMRANSYLYFYNYAVLKRRWWKKGKAPYQNPDVWCNFSPFFKKQYTQLPDRYIELYDKYC